MGTDIRADISKKNRYWISKHRYYELKHFCMQYKDWKKLYLLSLSNEKGAVSNRKNIEWLDPTGSAVARSELYLDRIRLIEGCANEAGGEFGEYILKAATEGKTYAVLRTNYYIPCNRKDFYERYRKFFYILSLLRK